jgi:hypothetical protein
MSRRVAFALALLALALGSLLLAPAALAAGNDVGRNLGGLLRQYAGELYGGIVAVVGLVFLFNRRFTDLAMFFLGGDRGRLAGLQPRPGRGRRQGDRPAGAAVNEGREPIRSYQRIFRPERRIYQIEGRALPVSGGVPLRWRPLRSRVHWVWRWIA